MFVLGICFSKLTVKTEFSDVTRFLSGGRIICKSILGFHQPKCWKNKWNLQCVLAQEARRRYTHGRRNAKGGVKTKRMSSDKGSDASLRLRAFWFYHIHNIFWLMNAIFMSTALCFWRTQRTFISVFKCNVCFTSWLWDA